MASTADRLLRSFEALPGGCCSTSFPMPAHLHAAARTPPLPGFFRNTNTVGATLPHPLLPTHHLRSHVKAKAANPGLKAYRNCHHPQPNLSTSLAPPLPPTPPPPTHTHSLEVIVCEAQHPLSHIQAHQQVTQQRYHVVNVAEAAAQTGTAQTDPSK